MSPFVPDGHFYSPVVDPESLQSSEARVWPGEPRVLGIDFNDASHERLLREEFPKFIGGYDYPEVATASAAPTAFYTRNPQYSWLDSRALFVLLRTLRPRRMIEIGSGYSSLLTADVNRRYLDGTLDFRCVEPYPPEFLARGVPGISGLLQSKVEDLALDEFDRLEAGDILFIDSSHVSKTGSDVNHIYFEIIPRLQAGVHIHIHDIFLPFEYPKHWVIGEGRSWNEQYVVRSLLMFTKGFEVTFGCSYAAHRFPDLLKPLLGGKAFGGGSLWLRKTV